MKTLITAAVVVGTAIALSFNSEKNNAVLSDAMLTKTTMQDTVPGKKDTVRNKKDTMRRDTTRTPR